jgi:hypothetical protein
MEQFQISAKTNKKILEQSPGQISKEILISPLFVMKLQPNPSKKQVKKEYITQRFGTTTQNSPISTKYGIFPKQK